MARHKQPRERAELTGATKKNSQRYKDKEETVKHTGPIGDPPSYMKAKPKKIWAEIVAQSLPGTLTASDRILVEIAANLLSEYRDKPEDFTSTKYTSLVGICARLGLSPADRQKVAAPRNPKEDDAFDAFFKNPRRPAPSKPTPSPIRAPVRGAGKGKIKHDA